MKENLMMDFLKDMADIEPKVSNIQAGLRRVSPVDNVYKNPLKECLLAKWIKVKKQAT